MASLPAGRPTHVVGRSPWRGQPPVPGLVAVWLRASGQSSSPEYRHATTPVLPDNELLLPPLPRSVRDHRHAHDPVAIPPHYVSALQFHAQQGNLLAGAERDQAGPERTASEPDRQEVRYQHRLRTFWRSWGALHCRHLHSPSRARRAEDKHCVAPQDTLLVGLTFQRTHSHAGGGFNVSPIAPDRAGADRLADHA